MRVLASVVTCTDTMIDSNTNEELTSGGGGVFIDSSSIIGFDGCTISNNDALAGSTSLPGGGMYILGTGTVVHCVFTGNSGLSGGGIYVKDIPAGLGGTPLLVISNCIFHHNTSDGSTDLKEDGAAAAIVAVDSNNYGTEFLNCVFADNTCRLGGSTVFGYNKVPRICVPTIRNCIIYGSNANGYRAYLAGVIGSSAKQKYNCFFNIAGHELLNDTFASDTEISLNGQLCPGTFYERNVGNIIRDPKFRDATTNNYRLDAGSNCADVGDPNPIRNDVDTTRNDIGAYGGPAGNW
jgi:predicted outer membrane repeat protein